MAATARPAAGLADTSGRVDYQPGGTAVRHCGTTTAGLVMRLGQQPAVFDRALKGAARPTES